ncbi:DegT/DnrJ/EryC1/StrS family aminotransferase [bacterium]|nr:DegT/DnrJ/EryC1/StrS family aminotransferase [bacterium]
MATRTTAKQGATAGTAALAINGGLKACPSFEAPREPKVGVDEFMALARRFGFAPEALERIRNVVSNTDLPPAGPNLARYWTADPKPPAGEVYEAAVKAKFGVKYALPVSCGTAALHAALVGIGVGPGKEVIVPAVGFLATSMAVAFTGGTPVFTDIDTSFQMDPTKLEKLITPRTVAVVPTHHWGGVCDLAPILQVARQHNLKVIEDCAQSPGGKYQGRYVGTWGDFGCFSISAYKLIGGGESGLLVANDQRLFERACQLAEAGGLWRPDRFGPPRYEGELFPGLNYRLSDLEAAINVVQLGKMDDYVRRHNAVRRAILQDLKTYREIEPEKSNDREGEPGYIMRFFAATPELGQQVAAALTAEGVGASCRGCNPKPDWHIYHYMFPLAGQHADRIKRGLCPVADDLWERVVMIGLDQWLTPNDCRQVAAAINKVLGAYCTADSAAKKWLG